MANDPIWPVQPLHNAADVPLSDNPGTLPNLSDALSNWFQPLYFEKVVKQVANFVLAESTIPMQFQGIVIPEPRNLVMASNGQRYWSSKRLFCWPGVELVPDDVVVYEQIQYRVLSRQNYRQYGYIEYVLVQDYTGSGPTGGVGE